MKEIFAWIFQGGKILDNFTTAGAVSTHDWTVPAGKRWIVLGGYCERDANATLEINLHDASNNFKGYLIPNTAAGTSNVTFGFSERFGATYKWPYPLIMKAGWYIQFKWGAAQTDPDVDLLVIEVDEP